MDGRPVGRQAVDCGSLLPLWAAASLLAGVDFLLLTGPPSLMPQQAASTTAAASLRQGYDRQPAAAVHGLGDPNVDKDQRVALGYDGPRRLRAGVAQRSPFSPNPYSPLHSAAA